MNQVSTKLKLDVASLLSAQDQLLVSKSRGSKLSTHMIRSLLFPNTSATRWSTVNRAGPKTSLRPEISRLAVAISPASRLFRLLNLIVEAAALCPPVASRILNEGYQVLGSKFYLKKTKRPHSMLMLIYNRMETWKPLFGYSWILQGDQ
jgi:hypothetical protein